MPRKPRDQLFRKSDVLRLIETAKRGGLHDYRIAMTRDGLTLIVGGEAKTAPTEGAELDNWMAKHHADER